jgi:hypothetical protein
LLGKPVPFHGKGNARVKSGIEGYVATAAIRPGCVGVLISLDADDECVAQEGPQLLARAMTVTGRQVFVAIAERDYEDWLYASIETLQLGENLVHESTKRGLTALADALAPRKYIKPTWQPRLTSRMDLALARRRSASLDRLIAKFDQLRALVP